jgi:hypothetical protein
MREFLSTVRDNADRVQPNEEHNYAGEEESSC